MKTRIALTSLASILASAGVAHADRQHLLAEGLYSVHSGPKVFCDQTIWPVYIGSALSDVFVSTTGTEDCREEHFQLRCHGMQCTGQRRLGVAVTLKVAGKNRYLYSERVLDSVEISAIFARRQP